MGQAGPREFISSYGGSYRLHFRQARLTRANQLCHSALRQIPADPKCMQTASETEFHFDERSLLLVEAQELSGRANLPSRTFKTSLLRAVHGTDPSNRAASRPEPSTKQVMSNMT